MNGSASETKPNQLILFRKGGGGGTTFPARDPAIMITEEEKRGEQQILVGDHPVITPCCRFLPSLVHINKEEIPEIIRLLCCLLL